LEKRNILSFFLLVRGFNQSSILAIFSEFLSGKIPTPRYVFHAGSQPWGMPGI
jgi:hypothetical protein